MTASHNPTCPPRDKLVQFLLGHLPEHELTAVERHSSACTACGDTLQALNAEDTLVELVRSARAEQPEAEMVDGLIARMRELPSILADGTDPSSGPVDGARDERAEGIRHFFRPPEQPDELGRLASYRVLKHLGSGGMGVVFEAEDEPLRRLVALKILRPSLGSGARARFLQEARAAAAIDHENVVTTYQVGEDHGLAFLSMQRLDGETLETLIQREGKLPTHRCARIGRQIALGLQAAHAANLIHRDVKPANIWVEAGRDRVKVLDFGLARVLDDEPQLTESGIIAGTPAYMSPEQARGHRVDQRSDLFSLGSVLYRLATGSLPFQGTTSLATLRAVEERHPPSPEELNPDVKRPLAELVMWLLEKDPSRRPQSADAVVVALEEIAEGKPQSIAPPGRATRIRVARRWAVGVAVVVLLAVSGFFAAPTIIRIVTNQGQLVIRTDDPDADIKIEVLQGGEFIRIVDPRTRQSVDLTAGEYEIKLADGANGWSLSTDKFTLTRGGEKIVEVWHEPSGIAPEQRAHAEDVSSVSEALTYGGKTLGHWLAEFESERKPERLAEAVRAISALGDEASAAEAARAIFLSMRAHGAAVYDGSPRGKLIDASRQALWEMPARAVIPAMIEEIRSGNGKSRGFMVWMTVRPSITSGYDMHRVDDLSREMKKRAGEILSVVLDLARDDSEGTRDWAVGFAVQFCGGNGIDPAKVEGLIPRFQEELHSRDASRILPVASLLIRSAPDTAGLVDSLTFVLSDKEARNRQGALRELSNLGPRAAPAVPKLVDLLTEYLKPTPSNSGGNPPWKGRAPYTMDLRIEIIRTLGKIGPSAKAALPVLRQAFTVSLPRNGVTDVKKAILQIEGAPPGDDP